MKKLVLVLIALAISTTVYAQDITITLTADQYKAMQVLNVTPEEWVQHAATTKANKMIQRLSKDYSDKQFDKMTSTEKETMMAGVDVVKEKNKRHGK